MWISSPPNLLARGSTLAARRSMSNRHAGSAIATATICSDHSSCYDSSCGPATISRYLLRQQLCVRNYPISTGLHGHDDDPAIWRGRPRSRQCAGWDSRPDLQRVADDAELHARLENQRGASVSDVDPTGGGRQRQPDEESSKYEALGLGHVVLLPTRTPVCVVTRPYPFRCRAQTQKRVSRSGPSRDGWASVVSTRVTPPGRRNPMGKLRREER